MLHALATALVVALAAFQTPEPRPCGGGAREVSGAVIDELSLRRLVDARVHARPIGQHELDARTDARGIFRICIPVDAFPALLYAQDSERISDGVLLQDATNAAQLVRLGLKAGAPVRVAGRVLDQSTGHGVANARVMIARHFVQLTDRNGRFEFDALPGGAFPLTAQHVEFHGATDTLNLVPGRNLDVTIPMTLAPLELPPIVVMARSKGLEQVGFYARRATGQGSYLTRAEIDKMRGIALPSDLLRGFNGVNLTRRPNGRGYRVVGRNQCPYRYYVDGVRIGPYFDFDDLEWHWIDAIEVYNGLGQIPARFADADPVNVRACGVVVVWTRQVAR